MLPFGGWLVCFIFLIGKFWLNRHAYAVRELYRFCMKFMLRSFVLFFALAFSCLYAVSPYEPKLVSSINDIWRWTELEALSDFDYVSACEGVNGDVWLGARTEVACYDGLDLHRYTFSDETIVLDVFASKSGDVFVLARNDLFILEGKKWKSLYRGILGEKTFTSGTLSENGDLWLSVSGGVFRYRKGKSEYFELAPFSANSMVVDFNEKLWLSAGNNKKVYVYDLKGADSGLVRKEYEFDVSDLNEHFRVFLDSDGVVWIPTPARNGDNTYFKDYKKLRRPSGLIGPFRDALALVTKHAFSMASMGSERHWICVPRGLAELDGDKTRFFDNKNLLPAGMSSVFALSNERLLVHGMESKAYFIDLSKDRWQSYSNLNFQLEAADGVLWYLEHDGRIVSQSRDGNEWLAYGVDDGTIDQPNRIYQSSDGTIWASGKYEGAAAIAYMKDRKWLRYEFPEMGSIISHLGVDEMSDGSIVFGSGTPTVFLRGGSGGAVISRKMSNGAWHFEVVAPPRFPTRGAVVVERTEDDVWFGGEGLRRRKGGLDEPIDHLTNLTEQRWIDDIVLDSKKNLWVAIWGKGVYQFDGDKWYTHFESDGLSDRQVINLLASEFGNGLWVATVSGLSRYDGQVWSNWSFLLEDQFSREGVTLREDRKGALWINYAYRSWLLDGVTDESRNQEFRTRRYLGNKNAPETILLSSELELPEGSPIAVDWTGKDRWSETLAENLEYSWRLGDGEWSGFSKTKNTIINGVGAGEFVFEVRARDRDWNIDSSPARVSIYVVPPLWKRTWFILLVIFTVGLIVFLVERLFKSRVRSALAMEEFKLEFFTNISHELRNPLAVILGPMESLLREDLAPRLQERVHLALRNARKLQGLVDQLLQFRKVELGKSTYRPIPGELIGFVRDTIQLQAPLWEARDLKVRFDPSQKHCVCEFDAEKLQKIVDNLLSNAIKYSDIGGCISVFVHIPTDEDGVREFKLIVEDHGQGISQHEMNLVMKPFYRARKKNSNAEGFGIGLPLVAGLVRICGGEIDMESPIDVSSRGTRVTVRMPFESADENDVEDDSIDLEVELDEKEKLRPAKILLVEDNLDLRQFMKSELAPKYEVLEAGNGTEGLEVALQGDLDLVVSDVMMPEMDGLQLSRELRSRFETSHVPIILLTAKSSEEDSLEGTEAGADVYFSKPLNMLKLLAQIENLLELRRKMKRHFSEKLVIEPKKLTVVTADEELLCKAISVVEGNMNDVGFGVDMFAQEVGLGRTALLNKLKGLTGESPGAFIRKMRMKRAAQLLESGVTVSETLEYVGIGELSHFSRSFKKEFGMSPTQFRKSKIRGDS